MRRKHSNPIKKSMFAPIITVSWSQVGISFLPSKLDNTILVTGILICIINKNHYIRLNTSIYCCLILCIGYNNYVGLS